MAILIKHNDTCQGRVDLRDKFNNLLNINLNMSIVDHIETLSAISHNEEISITGVTIHHKISVLTLHYIVVKNKQDKDCVGCDFDFHIDFEDNTYSKIIS